MEERFLPIGIQDFEKLRRNNFVYVDKTAFLYKLTKSKCPYFLSRPRRFGKSLFLSTLEAYFLGKKELFKGLAIENLEAENPEPWAEYPVLKFSLASGEFTKEEGLKNALVFSLSFFEEKYALATRANLSLPERFREDLMLAFQKTGRGVVVLVDEYDNPLLKNINVNKEQEEANRALYKGSFAVLNDCDAFLRFVFFTGVTKFSKVSIFSDLNQLKDISLDRNYDAICGITQEDLKNL